MSDYRIHVLTSSIRIHGYTIQLCICACLLIIIQSGRPCTTNHNGEITVLILKEIYTVPVQVKPMSNEHYDAVILVCTPIATLRPFPPNILASVLNPSCNRDSLLFCSCTHVRPKFMFGTTMAAAFSSVDVRARRDVCRCVG